MGACAVIICVADKPMSSEMSILLCAFSFKSVLMILVWNARGAAGKAFSLALKELCRTWKPEIVVLVETRCSGVKAQDVIRRLGFQNRILEEAVGMSGGIWILWNNPSISISVLAQSNQFIHCLITGLGHRPWCFSAVYGSPREQERKDFGMTFGKCLRTVRYLGCLPGTSTISKILVNRKEEALLMKVNVKSSWITSIVVNCWTWARKDRAILGEGLLLLMPLGSTKNWTGVCVMRIGEWNSKKPLLLWEPGCNQIIIPSLFL